MLLFATQSKGDAPVTGFHPYIKSVYAGNKQSSIPFQKKCIMPCEFRQFASWQNQPSYMDGKKAKKHKSKGDRIWKIITMESKC